jgi:hypothetical protein
LPKAVRKANIEAAKHSNQCRKNKAREKSGNIALKIKETRLPQRPNHPIQLAQTTCVSSMIRRNLIPDSIIVRHQDLAQ